LVSKSAFAREAGVTRQAVGKACLEGLLKDAMVKDRIDTGHPNAQKYLNGRRNRRGADPGPKRVVATSATADPAQTSNGDVHAGVPSMMTNDGIDISRYADMSLRELEGRFGSVRALKDWLEALKTIEDIRAKRLNNEESQKQLIGRELVKTHVFGFIEATNRRLLGDASKTIARRLYSLARADEPVEKGEALVRKLIESQLGPAKERAAKTLREAG